MSPFDLAWSEPIGAMLLNSVWQFTLLAALFALVRFSIYRWRPEHAAVCTYRLGCLTLLMMPAVAIWSWHTGRSVMPVPPLAESVATAVPVANLKLPSIPHLDSGSETTRGLRSTSAGNAGPSAAAGPGSPLESASAQPPMPASSATAARLPTAVLTAMIGEPVWRSLRSVASWLAGVWLMGLSIMALRPLAGLLRVVGLKRADDSELPIELRGVIGSIQSRIGVTRQVRLRVTAAVDIPSVVGAIRPLILLPPAAIHGLDTRQLELMIAHELAHIRRHDFFVNLIQTLVETVFFYHPAVWWVSRSIRQEREFCCDDLVVATFGSRKTYVCTLLQMEQHRPQPGIALAATDGSLLCRIRRLSGLEPQLDRSWSSIAWATSVVALSVVTMALTVAYPGAALGQPIRNTDSDKRPATAESDASSTAAPAEDAEPRTPREVVNRFLDELQSGKQTINGIRGSWQHVWKYTTREDGWSVDMEELARVPAFRARAELGNDGHVMVLTGSARKSVSSVQDRIGVFELVRHGDRWLIKSPELYKPEHAWLLAEGFHRNADVEWILQPCDLAGTFSAGLLATSVYTFEVDGTLRIRRSDAEDSTGAWRLDGNILVLNIDGKETRNRVVKLFAEGFSVEFGEKSRAGYFRINRKER